jgi:hypothetical protein
MGFSKILNELLKDAQSSLNGLPADGLSDQERLRWLERQLQGLVSHLKALLADIEAGCTLQNLGFGGEADFSDMVADLGIEIANLKGLIQTAKMLAR